MSREDAFFSLTVKDILKYKYPAPLIVYYHDTVDDLLSKCSETVNRTTAYVVDKRKRLLGKIRLDVILQYFFYHTSDTDEDMRTLLFGINPFRVEDLMQSGNGNVFAESRINEVIKIMREQNESALPVLNHDGEIVSEIYFSQILDAYEKIKYPSAV